MRRQIISLPAAAAVAVIVVVAGSALGWPPSAMYVVLALAMFVFILALGPLVLAERPAGGRQGERNGGNLVEYLIAQVRGDYALRLPSGSTTSTPVAPPPRQEEE